MYILHVFVLYLFSKTNVNNQVPSSKWNVYNHWNIYVRDRYSGRTIKLYITFVPIIRTSKHFWLIQCIWHQTRVTYLWCTTTCTHNNHCIWSQELWEHKFLVLKNGLLFCRSMVEWVCLLHKMIIKDLKMLQMKQKTTEGWLIVYMDWLITVIKPLIVILWRRNTHSTINL